MIRHLPISARDATLAIATLVGSGTLAGCSGGATEAMKSTVLTVSEGQREADRLARSPFVTKDPIATTKGAGTLGPAAQPVDEAAVKKAVERFVEDRKQKAGSYIAANVKLTPDGKSRILVLFTSENWCQPQGCDLVVFEPSTFGWRAVSTVSRVRAPVLVSTTVTAGWYDLWVKTGKEATKDQKSFVKDVRLQYGANGYPSTTSFAIAATQGAPEGQAIIQAATLELPEKARFATAGRDPDDKKGAKPGGLFGGKPEKAAKPAEKAAP